MASSPEKNTKMVLKALGIVFVIGGMVLMIARVYYREVSVFGSETTWSYLSLFGGIALFAIGFILLRFARRVTPRSEEAPVVWKKENVRGTKETSIKLSKEDQVPGTRKNTKEPKYERAKMSKFLIDPEDMKKKK